MTQYKSKATQVESVSTGLLDYPVLQAADILLYRTDLVPAGEDQKQHIGLTADIARRFNRLFGETLVIPQPLLQTSGARIMGLDDPTIKMSKSVGEVRKGHAIGLLDSPDIIRTPIMNAVTDSGKEPHFDQASAAVKNLLTIFEILSGRPRLDIEAQFEGRGYGYLKREVADFVIVRSTPIRNRCLEITRDRAYLEEALRLGVEKALTIAESTLHHVKDLIGLARRSRKDQTEPAGPVHGSQKEAGGEQTSASRRAWDSLEWSFPEGRDRRFVRGHSLHVPARLRPKVF